MKIGRLVKGHIPAIFTYCETEDPAEFTRLQDPHYAKETFGIHYPFCTPVARILPEKQMRYWRDTYVVSGVEVKVTSQWFNPPTSQSLPMLRAYLAKRGITADESAFAAAPSGEKAVPAASPARGRYRGNAIGNAQNLLVRNILSRLGDEQFNAADWEAVKADFNHRCAYCGSQEKLVMEHVVSINKQALGEHRLGNLVPACPACNAKKAAQDFRAFLASDPDRIATIEAHMAKHGYTPIGENDQLRQIIELAHQDVGRLADRYIKIINALEKDG